MQSTRARAELDQAALGVGGMGGGAVPNARAAVDAFLPVKCRGSVSTRCDRLAAANLDANFYAAFLAEFRVQKYDVIRISGRSLHLSADQQSVLVRDEQFAIVRDRGPTRAVHERVVDTDALGGTFLTKSHDFREGNSVLVVFLQRRRVLPSGARFHG